MQDKVMRPFRPPREVKERAPPVRRSPRKGAKPDNVTHVIPLKKGFKGMSEREAQETAGFREVLRWNTDSGSEGCCEHTVDSEEPTAFGLVYDRYIITEAENSEKEPSVVKLNIVTGQFERGKECGSEEAPRNPWSMVA